MDEQWKSESKMVVDDFGLPLILGHLQLSWCDPFRACAEAMDEAFWGPAFGESKQIVLWTTK